MRAEETKNNFESFVFNLVGFILSQIMTVHLSLALKELSES